MSDDKGRIRKLFDALDKRKVGYLDEEQFEREFRQKTESLVQGASKRECGRAAREPRQDGSNGWKARTGLGKDLVKQCDKTLDGRVTFQEFRDFVVQKDDELLKLFKKIAKEDQVIHVSKLRDSIREAGLSVSEPDLRAFVDSIDSKNDGVIDYTEWRDFLFLLPHPVTNLKTVFQFFHSVADVDFNSDSYAIPNKISEGGWTGQFKYLLAGGIAGAVSRTATAPLDRLKVLLQTETQTHRAYSQIVSIRKGVLRIYKDGGVLSFFKGNGLNVLKIMPESALKFYVFEHAKDYLAARLGKPKEQLGVESRLVAGGLAGLLSQFAIYPIETIKTRIMSQITNRPPPTSLGTPLTAPAKDMSIATAIGNLWKENGIKAFYRGCGPALVGIVPYAGVDLAVFETLKNTWMRMYRPHDAKMPIHIMLACGMVSGTCGAVLMYPLSLVRTRFGPTRSPQIASPGDSQPPDLLYLDI
ncbi:hypothetical protein HDU91_001216 [Kappamyces sp. JEL0680]|nr:hypothetical protein HDU91_001216 [Kappamyces sp. JEL0680]